MVRGSHQGGALYLFEAFGHAYLFVFLELLWGDILGHVVVAVAGLQILADGENLTTYGSEVIH